MKIRRSISIIIVTGSFLLLVVALIRMNHQEEVYHSIHKDVLTVRSPNYQEEKEDPEPVEVEKPHPALAGMVGKNTSFFDLMSKGGISAHMIDRITRKSKEVFNFRKIYPGQHYQLYTDSLGNFKRLEFAINDESYIEVELKEDDIQVERQFYPFKVEEKIASGIIKSSLFATIKQQSIPTEVGMKMVDIYAWDIDFFTDLRKNDYFKVIYEEKTRFDGLKKIGRITAAEFNTKGQSHYAFLFEGGNNPADYYDKNGNSLRKQLLKAPLSYSRISSSYSRRRYHPVLHRYMPHYGIDYAAPPGTPVMSTGDGTVIVASYRRGNGNYVKISHNSNYITYYLHLSRFGRGITRGAKVKQGQVIGYVGSTGYSTGPHLDYRVKKRGRFINPRLLELPPAEPVKSKEMPDFLALREKYIEKLGEIAINQTHRKTYYASEDKGDAGDNQHTRTSSPTTKHSTSN